MTDAAHRTPPKARVALAYDPRVRAAVYQVALLLLVLWLGYEIVFNVRANLEVQRIATGFGFFSTTAGFGINQSLIPYQEADTYGRAFLVGLLNTLLVSAIGIVFATILGFIIGIARLSPNWLIARIAGGYVELLRNLPLLFQIMFWYIAVLTPLPGVRQSIGLGLQPLARKLADGIEWVTFGFGTSLAELLRHFASWVGPPAMFLNNRGFTVPEPHIEQGGNIVAIALLAGIVGAIVLRIWARRRLDATGQIFPAGWAGLGLIVGLPFLVIAALDFPVGFTNPELRGFNFVGGVRLIPEFVALVFALSTYTAAFIAEVVRAGILAVSRGQNEAAAALGLRRGRILRLVVVPQALRVIVPPLTNQYLNLTKNSTLAAAIGYPDLFSVFAGTTLNITGQAIEIIAITMGVYLTISLLTSLVMGWYNARVQLAER